MTPAGGLTMTLIFGHPFHSPYKPLQAQRQISENGKILRYDENGNIDDFTLVEYSK